MAKRTWSVTATVFGGRYCGEFEAETGEEAIEAAMDQASVSVCHQCANDVGDVELGRFVATCGDDVVEDEPELTWQQQATAAGWTPPKKKRAKGGE